MLAPRNVAWMGLLLAISLGHAVPATAQQQAGPVVQLPTFRFFTVTTNASVPDRGSASLGGVSSSSTGQVERGIPGGLLPFRNRAFSRSISASQMHVTAHIHDLEGLDEAVLELARRRRGAADGGMFAGEPAPQTAFTGERVDSLENLAAGRLAQEAAEQQEAWEAYQRGQEAEIKGKLGAARIYYAMAARQGQGNLREAAEARLAELQSSR